MKKNLVSSGLDIGSTKIALSLLKQSGSKTEVVFSDFCEHNLTDDGAITDFSSLRDLVKRTINKALKKTNSKISNIFINVEGTGLIESLHSKATIPLNDGKGKTVGILDIKRLNDYARALSSDLDKEIIYQAPHAYFIDNKTTKQPKGLFARKIGVDLFILKASLSYLKNIRQIINSVGLDDIEFIYSAEALKNVFIDNQAAEALNVIIDIGGNNISISFYQGSCLLGIDCIPYGSGVLVKRISEGLKLPMDLSNDVLKSYGSAFIDDISESDSIVLKKSSQYQTVSRREFVGLIEPQVKDLLLKVKSRLDENQFLKNSGQSNLYLTGRICLMDGFLELAERILEKRIEFGKSKVPGVSNPKLPIFATSIGLALCAAKSEEPDFSLTNAKPVSNVFAWLKEVYQDYF